MDWIALYHPEIQSKGIFIAVFRVKCSSSLFFLNLEHCFDFVAELY